MASDMLTKGALLLTGWKITDAYLSYHTLVTGYLTFTGHDFKRKLLKL